MGADALERLAHLLGDARRAAHPVPELSGFEEPQTVLDGYAAQEALHRYFCATTSGVLVGWKVGATTTAMQKYLGVDGPAYGRILSTNLHKNGADLSASDFYDPGIECEIAMRIGADADEKLYSRNTIGEIIDSVLPAIEIVENRYGDFLTRSAPTLIADDFFHKACVLGTPVPNWLGINLATIIGRTRINGTVRGSGTGADIMGHPLEAVAWLANTLAEHGEKLTAGQIVLTGSVAPVIWIESATAIVETELEKLGTVSVKIR